MQGANRNSNMQSSACHSTTILFATRFKTGPEAKYSRYGFIVNLACPTVFSTCFIKCFILLQYLTDNLLPLRIYSYTFYLWRFLGPRSGGQAQELKEVLPAVVRDTVRDGKPRLGVAYQERHAQENHSEVFSGKKNMTSNMTFMCFFLLSSVGLIGPYRAADFCCTDAARKGQRARTQDCQAAWKLDPRRSGEWDLVKKTLAKWQRPRFESCLVTKDLTWFCRLEELVSSLDKKLVGYQVTKDVGFGVEMLLLDFRHLQIIWIGLHITTYPYAVYECSFVSIWRVFII